MTAFDVSAVLVAWNAGDMLATSTGSLRESAEAAGARLQVVIVDNASEDTAASTLALEEGDVRIRNPVNAGYGVAASQGMARAEAPWVLLVNPDVVVERSFFTHLVRAAHAAPENVATLVPEMRYAATPEIVNCRGVTVDEIGVPAEVDAGARRDAGASHAEPLGGSSGCCLLRIEAVRRLGGVEPVYFAYLEDVDLAVRLARAGYCAEPVNSAVAWHEGSAAAGATSPLKTFLVARNRRLLFRLEGPRGLRERLGRTVVELGHGLVSSAVGSPTSPWLGRVDALRLRRYSGFVRRARLEHDERSRKPQFSPRASLRATLRRKRAVVRAARH